MTKKDAQTADATRFLDPRDRLLVQFAAALALDCNDCLHPLIDQSQYVGVRREVLQEVAAEVASMAMKHKQANAGRGFREYDLNRDPY